ncbi:tRNA uridine-5-carboxymethylaminomethyl(34) synthesis enzyme MnmG, partial [bacterium]|nr:tRNA uridine-5-carboxymethylaminomethyl(34) synthesis enzyme MnmG [bacterium]
IIIGEYKKNVGPSGFQRAEKLTDCLVKKGLPMRRFKTGTPMRVLKSTVDFSKMVEQKGDEGLYPFSEMTDFAVKNSHPCYLTYTNEKTHKIISDNIDRSPLYNGSISSVGPRYCPSIETKIVKFADKERHQVFVEPEGEDTEEMYVQGLSTSLPYDVQEAMLHSVAGLENAKIMRYGYAIEYDCINPKALLPTLAVKGIGGLYCAGQINGSSGYEEAAGQGLVAGINLALYIENKEQVIFTRDQSYIGVLIDDLVTKGTEEPYRIMTSRAEYRLHLRQDNADLRLTELGRELGLVGDNRYARFIEKTAAKKEIIDKLKKRYSPAVCQTVFEEKNEPLPKSGISAEEILKRSTLSYVDLIKIDTEFEKVNSFLLQQIETEIKYEGYLRKQQQSVKEIKKMENHRLDNDFDYGKVEGLRLEARQKLQEIKPLSLAQASRISGVNPADIVVLMVHLQKNK